MTPLEVKNKLIEAGINNFVGVCAWDGDITIDLEGYLTYAQLAAIAGALGTDQIDIDSDHNMVDTYLPESWVTLVVRGLAS